MLYLIASFALAVFFAVGSVIFWGPLNLPTWTSSVFWSIIGAGAVLRLMQISADAWCKQRKARNKPCPSFFR